jgi:hypothetical protein
MPAVGKPQAFLIAAGVAAAVAGGVMIFGGASNDAALPDAARGAAVEDYAKAPTHTDLLSAPVAPGADITTGVTLPLTNHTAEAVLTGSAEGAFIVTNVTETPTADGTGVWFEITAHNAGSATVRFTAEIAYAPGSAALLVGSAAVP